jgi:cytochrome c oxidase assembly protein subunit 15
VPQSTALYPERPLVHGKAWKEMIHRYAAGTLGLLLLGVFIAARRVRPLAWARPLSAGLLGLVIFQALLGMWTVTMKLQPAVVMAHLFGGLTVTAMVLILYVRSGDRNPAPAPAGLTRWGRVAMALLFLQVLLGGWTSANYAAPVCPDFPQCQGAWWPAMDFTAALAPAPPEAGDYEGGTLDGPARTAIHVVHRIGAVVTFVIIGALALALLRRGQEFARRGAWLAVALLFQVTVGIAMVLWQFPLALAVAHNAGALMLVLATVRVLMDLPPARAVQGEPLLTEST